MKRISRTLTALALGALLLSACGSSEVLGPPETDPEDQLMPNDPLMQIHSEGGFVPVEWNLGRGPTFTVTQGGDFIYQGAITLEYPGRLVLPYLVAELDEDQISEILAYLQDMGIAEIDDEHDSSVDNLADASTEVIRYWDDNGVHRYSVYALRDLDQPASDTTAAFAELYNHLHNLSASIDGTPYQPERVRIVAGADYEGHDPDFVDIRDWPLEGENPDAWETFATGGEGEQWTCKVFDSSVLEIFDDATQVTLWTHPAEIGDAQNLMLLVRPLHPGEEDCSI